MHISKWKPAQVLVLSFLVVVLIGAILLSLPFAVTGGTHASLLTALFTATSATCVTGLTVVDTGTYFSFWGQIVILFLMQIGGIGIMTLSTFFAATVFKRKISIQNRIIVQGTMDTIKYSNVFSLIKYVLIFTGVIETIGALIMFINFYKIHSLNYVTSIKYAVFHSVSAFANAGFSLFPTSLQGYRSDYIVLFVIMSLIILGGLGFNVLEELREKLFSRSKKRLSLHTKIVLKVSLALIVVGALLLFLFEYNHAFYGVSTGNSIINSFFQSVTARTAGFNTISISRFSDASLFILIILMFIGASPGSTGGGIKTTTLAVLYYSVRSIIRGNKQVYASKKAISFASVNRAISILLISLSLVFIFTILLLATEHSRVFMNGSHGTFIKILFEVISAFGTVGLSTGITPHLSSPGRLIITIAMFVGRLGPLTIALALVDTQKLSIKYPEERVMVG